MRIFFLLALTICLFPPSAWAVQANGCPDFVPAIVSVKQLVQTPTLNSSLDLRSLRQMALSEGQKIIKSNHDVPVGLTAAGLKLESQFEIRIVAPAGDRMVCAQLSTFVLNFGFDDTVVYLARELPHGTCSYQTVYDHEMQHVRTDQELVRTTAPIFPNLLQKLAREIGVIRASSAEVAQRQIKTIVNQYMADLGASLSKVRRDRQMQIDTPEEYARLGRSCNGDLSRLIASARRQD